MLMKMFAGTIVLASLALSAPTFAGESHARWSSPSGNYTANYSAGGSGGTNASALGGHTNTWSTTTQGAYGSADVTQHGISNLAAGSSVSTSGGASSHDYGWGGSYSSTATMGGVEGGATVSWSRSGAGH